MAPWQELAQSMDVKSNPVKRFFEKELPDDINSIYVITSQYI